MLVKITYVSKKRMFFHLVLKQNKYFRWRVKLLIFETQGRGLEVGAHLQRIPRTLLQNPHAKVHKALRLPRHRHLKVHKVLRLPGNLRVKARKILRLPRICTHFIHTTQPCQGASQQAKHNIKMPKRRFRLRLPPISETSHMS